MPSGGSNLRQKRGQGKGKEIPQGKGQSQKYSVENTSSHSEIMQGNFVSSHSIRSYYGRTSIEDRRRHQRILIVDRRPKIVEYIRNATRSKSRNGEKDDDNSSQHEESARRMCKSM